MATGIRDKVAILGMGCSKFGERWDKSAEDLMVEAFVECLDDAGIEKMRYRLHGWAPARRRCPSGEPRFLPPRP